ncbi:hypothetical protein BOX15_Mlig018465g1 [Macrostomum lignano]|uniref:BHLH domain-containing protein n=1 Tax=Macrostomum lignano TaxID=282301 RepID=A0A267F440_9PLAT|nr:hypothetical protein BOX15_Mlig018465g1 [Macrostomum lignano]
MKIMRGNGNKASGYSSNGLVMLYEAAMLIEQQSSILQKPATSVPQSALASQQTRDIISDGLQHTVRAAPVVMSPSQQQQRHQPPSNGFRVPTGTAIRVPIGPGSRVRLEPAGTPASWSSTSGVAANSAAAAGLPSRPPQSLLQQQHRRTVQSVSSRSSHNELEKNRRAHLRQCLDSLRDQLPMCPGQANRLTMLNVLNRSHSYLKELQSRSSEQANQLSVAQRRQKELLVRRDQMRRNLRTLRRQLTAAKSAKKAAAAAAAASAASNNSSDAWRCRNVSEISAASASSEEMELSAMDNSNSNGGGVGSGSSVGRAVVCDSPDSGYATPPSCGAATAAAAAAASTIMA